MEPILKRFLETISPYRNDIRAIRLFGSRARRDEQPDSDYDLLLLVDRKDRKMIDGLYDGVMTCLLEFGRLISLKIFTEDQWKHLSSLRTPFSQAVNREGISIG